MFLIANLSIHMFSFRGSWNNLVWGSQKLVATRRVDASRRVARPPKQHVNETHVFDSKLKNPYVSLKGSWKNLVWVSQKLVAARRVDASRRAARPPKHQLGETNVFNSKFKNPYLFP